MEWTDGYITELEYTHGFYRELNPSLLAFALNLKGIRAPGFDEPFDYCELGCGQGFSVNLMASCYPQGRFFAFDFNPAHIVGARQLAKEAGLTNVTFLENSFAELAGLSLPQFDFITLHGVWSWINDENRTFILEFLRTHLKPGGLVYCSYNCQPGWGAATPLRKLMVEYAHAASGALPERIEQAISFACSLREANAAYFRHNPMLTHRLDKIKSASRNYLAHEYFNNDWSIFYSSDVAATMSKAKLSFGCSAAFNELLDVLVVSDTHRGILQGLADATLQEQVKDYLVGQQFRKDIFVRGKASLPQSVATSIVMTTPYTLITTRSAINLKITCPVGEMDLRPEVYNPILDEFSKASQSVATLLRVPAIAAIGRDVVQQAVLILLAAGYILPIINEGNKKLKELTTRFNMAVIKRSYIGDDLAFLASPVVATGIPVDLVDRLFLGAMSQNKEPQSFAWKVLAENGRRLLKDGVALETEADNQQEITKHYQIFSAERLPIYKRLGIV